MDQVVLAAAARTPIDAPPALAIDLERVNVNGGADALGHPLAGSGLRLVQRAPGVRGARRVGAGLPRAGGRSRLRPGCRTGIVANVTKTSHAALISGCSSGIGRATAKLLAAEGWTVYATARRVESIADLEPLGCRLLALDVTDDDSTNRAVQAVTGAEGAVGVLVNNAGINELGALESVPLDRVRRMFETNVFGAIRMCQLVLPGMRAQGWGRIVNVGSMNGRFTFPGMGTYCATKHALEAVSDALRFEVRPFGVDVSLIEPGMVKTGFADTAAERRVDAISDGAYADYNAKVAEAAQAWDDGPMARLACGPEDVADTVLKAIRAKGRPRARYRVAASAGLMLTTRKFLPDAAFDAFMRTQFPSPDAAERG